MLNTMNKIWLITVIAVLVSRKAKIALAAPAPLPALMTTTTRTATPKTTPQFNLQITNRTAWQAAPSRKMTSINGFADGDGDGVSVGGGVGGNIVAVPYVIIHHTASPGACHTAAACKVAVRSVQRSHQLERGWDDIGYNFLIGGGGAGAATNGAEIYEGRGFGVIGAHAVGYNSQSVGICLIGDWSDSVPPTQMLEKLSQLIDYGVQSGYIQKNYKLVGHRQLRATACPGNKLFNAIKQWEHFEQRIK